MAQLNLKQLWSSDALMLYAGAVLGFYGSRALFKWVVSPLITRVAGEGGTGLSDPNNYKELTDVVTAGILLAFVKDTSMRRGVMANVNEIVNFETAASVAVDLGLDPRPEPVTARRANRSCHLEPKEASATTSRASSRAGINWPTRSRLT